MQVEYCFGKRNGPKEWRGACKRDTSFIGGPSCWRCYGTMDRIAFRMVRKIRPTITKDYYSVVKSMEPWAWCIKILRQLNGQIRFIELRREIRGKE